MNSFIVVALALVAVAHAGHLGGGSYGGGFGGGYGSGSGSGGQILIIKGAGGSGGGAGGSLTVAGPSHVIKTIHQVRTIDNGGQILSKSGGGFGGQAKILVAQVAGTAAVQQASLGGGHGGAGGWSAGGSADGHGGWSAGGSGGW